MTPSSWFRQRIYIPFCRWSTGPLWWSVGLFLAAHGVRLRTATRTKSGFSHSQETDSQGVIDHPSIRVLSRRQGTNPVLFVVGHIWLQCVHKGRIIISGVGNRGTSDPTTHRIRRQHRRQHALRLFDGKRGHHISSSSRMGGGLIP